MKTNHGGHGGHGGARREAARRDGTERARERTGESAVHARVRSSRAHRPALQAGSPNPQGALCGSVVMAVSSSASSVSSVVVGFVAALTLCAAAFPVAAAPAPCEAPVRAAIVEALRMRMGASVSVQVNELSCAVDGVAGAIVATPEPGARLGSAIRFALSERVKGVGPRKVAQHTGQAVASVVVSGPLVRAARAIDRGTVLAAADVESATGEITDGFVRPLPPPATVVGAKAARAIAAGETIGDTAIVAVPLVRSGDRVAGGRADRGNRSRERGGGCPERHAGSGDSRREPRNQTGNPGARGGRQTG